MRVFGIISNYNVYPALATTAPLSGWGILDALPLIAIAIWFTGNFMAARVLNGSYDSVHKLQAGTQLTTKRSVTILTMNAEIDRQRGFTTLVIKTTAPTLQMLEYEFPFTQANQIEAAIAKELAMPITDVRKSIGYRIKD